MEVVKYLGVMISGDGRMEEEVRSRIRKAARVIGVLNEPVWKWKELSMRTKLRVYNATRCSGLHQGESGSQYEGYPFIATHKSSLGVTGSHALLLEVAVQSPVDCALTALQCTHPTLGNSLPPISVEASMTSVWLKMNELHLLTQNFLQAWRDRGN